MSQPEVTPTPAPTPRLRLTQTAKRAGCAAKHPPATCCPC